jgi:hypothetical protein
MVSTKRKTKGRNHNEDLNLYRPMEIRYLNTPERMRITTLTTMTVKIVSVIGIIIIALIVRMEEIQDCMQVNKI